MFYNNVVFKYKKPIRSPQQFMMKIGRGERPIRPENIPDCYWFLINNCWKQNPDERLTFEQISELLKDDIYAIEEYGMKTDIEELHKYQQRIDIEIENIPLVQQSKFIGRKKNFIWTRH